MKRIKTDKNVLDIGLLVGFAIIIALVIFGVFPKWAILFWFLTNFHFKIYWDVKKESIHENT